QKLLVLEGERLSYRGLDVEQIGSVYEAAMGFRLERARGRSVALAPTGNRDAPTTINLEALLERPPSEREKWLLETYDEKLPTATAKAVRASRSEAEILAALEKRIDRRATPEPVPAGAMILQPSPERRRTGSHYTPRALTEPIVEAALRPVLEQLGAAPRADAILGLKICDPACGSGAFLVEACRQLATRVTAAWQRDGDAPTVPLDEDDRLHACRLVAQGCLYGVDKNPLAVELAKLSLWLATLAKEHPFTFLDHALRAGDALAGLNREQIARFGLTGGEQITTLEVRLAERLKTVGEYRSRIIAARDQRPYAQLEQELGNAENAMFWPRLAGDAAVAAFFAAGDARSREVKRLKLETALGHALGNPLETGALDEAVEALRRGGVTPFHWEIEFPEVFAGAGGGFDAVVGNPPFAGKNALQHANAEGYLDWLKTLHPESHGNSDLVAHFFRRAFTLLRPGGCFGLIATSTISQGDTRSTGLRWICGHGGTIYRARKRIVWPGRAAVVVSVVHVCKGAVAGPLDLDGRAAPVITAFLFHAGGSEDPVALAENAEKSFTGSYLLGMGFTFDDTDKGGAATPLAEMAQLIAADRRNQERIFPYLGGEEVNSSPTHAHHRYVINFEDYPLRREAMAKIWAAAAEAERRQWLRTGVVPLDYPGPVAADWPELLAIVERKVKPERERVSREARRV